MFNETILIVALLGALIVSPVHLEDRSMLHVYAAIFVQISAALVLAYLVSPAETVAACTVMIVVYASQIGQWVIGNILNKIERQRFIKGWEHDAKEMARR